MDIKEIALKIARRDWPANDVHAVVASIEEAVAEIQRRGEPLCWIENDVDPEIGLIGIVAHDRNVEGSIPVFAFPPTAEQIANETAEAIAEYCRNQDHYCLATEIESGAWKEFK